MTIEDYEKTYNIIEAACTARPDDHMRLHIHSDESCSLIVHEDGRQASIALSSADALRIANAIIKVLSK